MAQRIDDTGFSGIMLTQDTDSFCYGIDAVLLAHFAARGRHKTYADLGTNNGVIPLLLTSMTKAERLVGIEMQTHAAELAQHNVDTNDMADRIRIVNCDVLDAAKHFQRGSFDAVVSNPPYFRKGSGIVNAADALVAARHETTAELDDFVKCAAYLLGDRGAFYMIHRPDRLADIIWSCRNASLEPKCLRFISPKAGKAPNLMLIECRKGGGRELKFMDPLTVYNEDGSYTDEIDAIYGRKREQ